MASRQTTTTGTLDAAFSCIAKIGAGGCGFEAARSAQARARRLATRERGFLRDGAYLRSWILTTRTTASVENPRCSGSTPRTRARRLSLPAVYAYQCDTPISASGPGTYTNCRVRRQSYLRDPTYYAQFLATSRTRRRTVSR